jgi:uncharacterized metal-binding protein YceD (DUF177 family)
MKNSRVFEIAWQGLKLGEHELIFDLDDKFLIWKYPETEYKQLNVQIKVTFDKQVNFFMFHFNIDGSLVVPCDRCGEEFELSLWDEFDLLVKLNDVEDEDQIEEEADVVFISRSETVLDISDWLYEFLMLSIPLQKIHPQDAKGNDTCNSTKDKEWGNSGSPYQRISAPYRKETEVQSAENSRRSRIGATSKSTEGLVR